MPYRWVCFEQTSKLEENYSAFFEAFSFESQSSGRGEKKFDAFWCSIAMMLKIDRLIMIYQDHFATTPGGTHHLAQSRGCPESCEPTPPVRSKCCWFELRAADSCGYSAVIRMYDDIVDAYFENPCVPFACLKKHTFDSLRCIHVADFFLEFSASKFSFNRMVEIWQIWVADSGGQNYLLPAMDMAKVGGPLPRCECFRTNLNVPCPLPTSPHVLCAPSPFQAGSCRLRRQSPQMWQSKRRP